MGDYFYDKLNKTMFYDIAVFESTGWFCNRNFCTLFRIDLNTGEISIEADLPIHSQCEIDQYSAIEYYKGNLIIAPKNGIWILVYNVNSKEITQIKFNLDKFDDANRYNLFTKIHIVNNIAYFVPGRYNAILKLNLDTYEIGYLESWYEKLIDDVIDIRKVISGSSVIYNKYLRIADWQSAQLIDVNLNDGNFYIEKVKEYGGVSSIYPQKDSCWVSYKNNLKVLNTKNLEEIIVNAPNMNFDSGICSVFAYKDKIYIFPVVGNMVISIDLKNGIQEEFIHLPNKASKEMESVFFTKSNFICVKEVKEGLLIACSLFESKIYIIDLNKEKYKVFSSVLSNEMETFIHKKIRGYYHSVYEIEKSDKDLKNWLYAIKNIECNDNL